MHYVNVYIIFYTIFYGHLESRSLYFSNRKGWIRFQDQSWTSSQTAVSFRMHTAWPISTQRYPVFIKTRSHLKFQTLQVSVADSRAINTLLRPDDRYFRTGILACDKRASKNYRSYQKNGQSACWGHLQLTSKSFNNFINMACILSKYFLVLLTILIEFDPKLVATFLWNQLETRIAFSLHNQLGFISSEWRTG